jgi:hypothetical protein
MTVFVTNLLIMISVIMISVSIMILKVISLSIITLRFGQYALLYCNLGLHVECHYAKCHYMKCHYLVIWLCCNA